MSVIIDERILDQLKDEGVQVIARGARGEVPIRAGATVSEIVSATQERSTGGGDAEHAVLVDGKSSDREDTSFAVVDEYGLPVLHFANRPSCTTDIVEALRLDREERINMLG